MEKENEEISLVDLFTVVIRYRKVIITGTIISIILSALFIFIIQPKIKPAVPQYDDVTATYTIRINYMPQKLVEQGIGRQFNVWWDWHARLLKDFINPTIIGPLYEKNQFALACKEGEGERYINSYIKKRKITSAQLFDTAYAVTITMPILSEEKLNDFINAFIDYEHNLIQKKYLANHIELLEERCKRKINEVENANPKTVNFDEIQKAKDILKDIETYRKEKKPFYEIEGKPLIEKPEVKKESEFSKILKNLKKMLVATFVSLFIFIFIAFLLNVIHNIKEDPEASKKIKDAWDSGK